MRKYIGPYQPIKLAQNAARKYLRTGITEEKRAKNHRTATAEVVYMCIIIAMNQLYQIGEGRAQSIVERVKVVANKYSAEAQIIGEVAARKRLRDSVSAFAPKEDFILPAIRPPRTNKDWKLLGEKRAAADVMMLFFIAAIHDVIGYGRDRIEAIEAATEKAYREFGSYAETGDYYGYAVLARTMGQILHTEVDIEESGDMEPIFGDTIF